ncbi:MAG: hypothetical protein Q8R15_00905, partial [Candidatus Micrarchaeota archaeon]|nr:hypothetical protein [Candidatus Micrarchaeota archaeon]
MATNEHPIPAEYHPSKAVRKEAQGAFNIYHFKDGTQLTVRKMHERKLFGAEKETKWKTEGPLQGNSLPQVYSIGKAYLVSRHNIIAQNLREHYQRLYSARVRFEQPLAWLTKYNFT